MGMLLSGDWPSVWSLGPGKSRVKSPESWEWGRWAQLVPPGQRHWPPKTPACLLGPALG